MNCDDALLTRFSREREPVPAEALYHAILRTLHHYHWLVAGRTRLILMNLIGEGDLKRASVGRSMGDPECDADGSDAVGEPAGGYRGQSSRRPRGVHSAGDDARRKSWTVSAVFRWPADRAGNGQERL